MRSSAKAATRLQGRNSSCSNKACTAAASACESRRKRISCVWAGRLGSGCSMKATSEAPAGKLKSTDGAVLRDAPEAVTWYRNTSCAAACRRG